MTNIEKLSEMTGLNPLDIKMIAKGIAIELSKDKVADVYVNGDREIRKSLTEAYMDHEIKKFQRFAVAMRNPDTKSIVCEMIDRQMF